MGKLQKIKLENIKNEIKAPFNYCDRWCERCTSDTKKRCSVYQDEFETKLNYLADGKDPESAEACFESAQKSFEKTMGMIKEIAENENIDLEYSDEESQVKLIEKETSVNEHPLFMKAHEYQQKVQNFFDDNYDDDDDDDIADELDDAYETLNWYHTLLPAKVNRFLCDMYANELLADEIEVDPEDIDIGLFDAVAQMEVCLKAIESSKKALNSIFNLKMEFRYEVSDMTDILLEIEQKILLALKNIDTA